MGIDFIAVLALVLHVVVERLYVRQHRFSLQSPASFAPTDVNVCEHPGTEQGMRGESSGLEEGGAFGVLGALCIVFMWFLNSSMLEAVNEQPGTLQMQTDSLCTFS